MVTQDTNEKRAEGIITPFGPRLTDHPDTAKQSGQPTMNSQPNGVRGARAPIGSDLIPASEPIEFDTRTEVDFAAKSGRDLFKILDSEFARDQGGTGRGYSDPDSWASAREFLAGLDEYARRGVLSRWVCQTFLTDDAIREGMGYEWAGRAIDWINREEIG